MNPRVRGTGRWMAGAAVYMCGGGVGVYRGISGVDCALLAWVLVAMARQDGGFRGAAWIGALMLVAVKAIYEQVFGVVLLPTSAPAGVEVVGVTHVVGLALGAGMAILARKERMTNGRTPMINQMTNDETRMTNDAGRMAKCSASMSPSPAEAG